MLFLIQYKQKSNGVVNMATASNEEEALVLARMLKSNHDVYISRIKYDYDLTQKI